MNTEDDFLDINVFDSNIEDNFMPNVNHNFIHTNEKKIIRKACIDSTLFHRINFLISDLKEKIQGINSSLQVIEIIGPKSPKTIIKLKDELSEFTQLLNSLYKIKVTGLQLINESEFFTSFYSGLATLCEATINKKNQIIKEAKLVNKNGETHEKEEVRKEFFDLEEMYDILNNLVYDLLISCYTMDFREELVNLIKSLNKTRIRCILC
ncbi:hypothetical protein [Clostridium tarantellae]|uniref:Uncharacterized protein n=1 Tax=Clostridium tarantellae TaxID=39493 RepID=A0A6I1MLJ1_9CLOT|nr:hypothetical protein [Clostridium tarantellae]MPQ43603.1 hypothetical protein [Clostridium tarantellae]